MPLVPPVMSAIFPSSLPIYFLLALLAGRSPWRPTSASIRLLPAKRHARRRGACHEALFLVGDVTLDKTERFSALDDPPGRPKLCGPHGLQEIDLQLDGRKGLALDRKSTRLNSSHMSISYAVFCLKKKKNTNITKTINIKISSLTYTT